MPRPRNSEAVLRLKGTWRKDRHGPVPAPEGEPLSKTAPEALPADVRAAWADIVGSADGRLVQADAVVVEVAARCLARVRSPKARGQDSANLLRCLAALQIDAAHRRALAPPSEPNPFDQF